MTTVDFSRVWAETGDKRQPDLVDYEIGWTEQIPTYQVLNWLQYRTDKALRALAERGAPQWGADVAYKQNAVAWDDTNNVIYIALVDDPNTMLPPSQNPDEWIPSVIQFSIAENENLSQELTDHINNHNNPHQVTAHQIGSLTKNEIDALKSGSDETLDAHINDTGNPHGTTATDIGAVATTGGAYTGNVDFLAKLLIQSAAEIFVDATATQLKRGDRSIGFDTGKTHPQYNRGAESFDIVTSENVAGYSKDSMREAWSPNPDFEMRLKEDINIQHGVGKSYPTVEPKWDVRGLDLTGGSLTTNYHLYDEFTVRMAANPLENLVFVLDMQTSTGQLSVWLGNEMKLRVKDASGNWVYLSTGSVHGQSHTCVFSYDGTTLRLYNDGKLADELTIALPGLQESCAVELQGTGLQNFSVWDTALNSNQIGNL